MSYLLIVKRFELYVFSDIQNKYIILYYSYDYTSIGDLLLLSAFPIRGRHSGFSFSSFSYQLYPPPSLQPQPCPLSPHP